MIELAATVAVAAVNQAQYYRCTVLYFWACVLPGPSTGNLQSCPRIPPCTMLFVPCNLLLLLLLRVFSSSLSRLGKGSAWSICEHWAQRNQLYKVLYVQFLEFPSSSMNQPTSCKHVQYAPWATDLNCGVELWMHRVKRYPSSRRHRRLIKIVRLRRS